MYVDSAILIVDDQLANSALLLKLLQRAGYTNIKAIADPRAVAAMVEAWRPDILLLDLQMPHMDGFEVMEQLRQLPATDVVMPILVLTADATTATRDRALRCGAKDFLVKPFDATETLLRIHNLLETRALHQELAENNRLLEQRVIERTRELEASRSETLARLALAADYRDDDTGHHIRRVGAVSGRLATELRLDPVMCALIREAAPLHDVGKIGVPDSILLKPAKLNEDELEIVRTHTTIGRNILSGGSSPLMLLAEEIALTHHERWDGTGYAGLAGPQIPLAGRIVAVADVYDALTHIRPYKTAWPMDLAVDEIRLQRGKQFDPEVVDAFLGFVDELATPRGAYALELPQLDESVLHEIAADSRA